jgi:hypothetical protein
MSTSTIQPVVALPPAQRLRGESWVRRFIIGLSAGVIVLSMLLSLGSEREQVLLPVINQPLPPLCQLKMLTGIDCPGCGLTRSFIALGHGQWGESFRFNPAGPLWFAFIALQIPYQALQLRRITLGQRPLDLTWWGQGLIYAGLTALILQWVVRQFGWF